MDKRIPEAEPYAQLFVEFQNSEKKFLTLERSLAGGDLAAHQVRIASIKGTGKKIVPSRSGKSQAKDVTAILFEFAGIGEAKLRKNNRGEVQRLTIRTMLPVILVDEISVIDERSPVLGDSSFDTTARKRAFAYMLSGKDDTGIVTVERKDIANARRNAQLGIISDLLSPIEERLQKQFAKESDESIDKIEEAIGALSESLADRSQEREDIEAGRRAAIANQRKAESQIVAIDELLTQYRLLDDRYRTDLARLDFIAEGAHFFDGLQEVKCPLCDQLMSPDHAHRASESSQSIYQAARAEAAKILAHRADLIAATESLNRRRVARETEASDSLAAIEYADSRIKEVLAPTMQVDTQRLESLINRRVELEAIRSDETQASSLRQMKDQIENATGDGKAPSKEWEPLPSKALRAFCAEVERILAEWKWKGDGRVEFDQSAYDIIVDGQSRRSHGKGVRAVLYSAFVIGLLKYCKANQRPHLGTIIIDSPLTSYKKGKSGGAPDSPIDAGIEAAFWRSLAKFGVGAQLIIIENKEPPSDVATAVHYEWFAGENAQSGERVGFIPTASRL
ncbi:hypothetical protein GWE18_20820 [Bradyrhizobium sp. CSA112]|uniref:hypothetical protein n=1 Tax=Bradyrhizobium sp. CSA112 TaxID=2699170 RepID=UPI0023B0C1B1|nr:hypothetical protein [Bradyrhizobium sp. CSA112]MDE5455243.1 hypothetical protein [Bradyrhizobium sp. CSA112]